MNFVAPESLVFWTTLIFVIFFFILRKVAWGPILNAVKSREESINNALEAAEQAKKEMAQLNADNERILKEARLQQDTIIKEAREIKENMITVAKEEAQAEAAKIIESAMVTIENEKQAAINELKNSVASLSVEIAEKIIRKELSSDTRQEELVEQMLNEMTLN